MGAYVMGTKQDFEMNLIPNWEPDVAVFKTYCILCGRLMDKGERCFERIFTDATREHLCTTCIWKIVKLAVNVGIGPSF
jgi:hypothetical protein